MKHLVWAAVVAAGAVVLVACGGGGANPGGGSGNPPPSPTTYTVGGTVTGLSGTVVLQNNAGNDLAASNDGTFTFSTGLTAGTAYSVSVMTQPSSAAAVQTCSVTNGSGTVSTGNVANVTVSCISTMINGIAVPPPPGAVNDTTLLGIDSDNNGIRDDLDIFIATKYGTNASATAAARILGRDTQEVFATDPSQRDAARIAVQGNGDAGVCAGSGFYAAGLKSWIELREFYLRAFNTPDRLRHDQRIGAAAGQVERSVNAAVCP